MPADPIKLPSGADVTAAINSGASVLLPRGATFAIAKTLVLADGQTIGAWWSEVGQKPPRPRLVFDGLTPGFVARNVSGVRLDSLVIEATGGGKLRSYGVECEAAANVTIENCVVSGWRFNVNSHNVTDLTLRGTLIEKSWTVDHAIGHSSGIYAYQTTTINIDRCAFVRNGLSKTGGRSMYNHGAYIAASCLPLFVTDTAFVGNSSHGLQARGGGNVSGCIFVDNPVGLSHGLVNGSAIRPGGVSGSVSRLVFIGGAPIDATRIGYCAEFGNSAGTVVSDLLAAHDSQNWDSPFVVNPCLRIENPPYVSPSRIDFVNLLAFDWKGHPTDVTRQRVLREATPATGKRERIERLAPAPVNLRTLLGDVEAAARRDPWVCARNAVKAARDALKLDVDPFAAERAALEKIDAALPALRGTRDDIQSQVTSLLAKLGAAEQALDVAVKAVAAAEAERARLAAVVGL